MRKRRCGWCGEWFYPHARLKGRQRSCGRLECKRQQNLKNQRRWKRRERGAYLENQRDWHKDHPGYWKGWRGRHPGYVQRNRVQSRIRKSFLRAGLQKKLDILEVTEKTMEYWNLPRFVKSTRSLVPLWWAYTAPHEHLESDSP